MPKPDNEIDPTHEFESGAVRSADCDELRYSLIPPQALRALAKRYAFGEKKYSAHNWAQGMTFSSMVDHLVEHAAKFLQRSPGEEDDIQNLAAIMWGAAGLIYFIETGRTELDDRFFGKE